MIQDLVKARPPASDAVTPYPPCQVACPIHQDARGYLASIARGDFRDSLEVVMEVNPLPAVCGTICAHPCEDKCRRGKVDQPLSIRCLKRVAVEYGGKGRTISPAARRQEKVAIIGSGPAGLTAAHDLAVLGFQVTIFEREETTGGMLQNAIPLYRLPRSVIAKDIDSIKSLGVEIRTGVELGKGLTLSDLKQAGYQAILLCMGLSSSRGLRIPGAENKNVILALPFLKAVNEGTMTIDPTRDIIVIGGGNVAMDVARSAVRIGAKKVRIVCLESREEMPAFSWEIEEAIEEGIKIDSCSWGPKRILEEESGIVGLECKKVTSVFDAQGRFNPSYDESVLTTIGGDLVIMAIGQGSELSYLKDMGVALNEKGQLVVDKASFSTGTAGVFACGEVASGPGTAVQSMANGRKAAISIASFLMGQPLPSSTEKETPALGDIATPTIDHIKRSSRNAATLLPVDERRQNFEHVELVFSRETAAKEARRCLSCGAGAVLLEEKCVACLTCVRVCPYKVPVVHDGGHIAIPVDNCQACGICVNECPAGAITFNMAPVAELPQRIESAANTLAAARTRPRVLCFHCSYGAFALHGLGRGKGKASPNLASVSVPCISKIGLIHLLKAFELGADGVFVAGCDDPTCHLQESSFWAGARLKAAGQVLQQLGLPPERLQVRLFPDAEVPLLEEAIMEFSRGLEQTAPGQAG